MKIVFIGGRNIHELGGIENYMYNLTQELSKLGHECVVWCESDHNEVEYINGVKVTKSNLICKPWCGLKATIKTLLYERHVSFIHYNAWPPSLWSWIPRVFGIPSLMEGHGLEWQRSKYSLKAQRIMKLMEAITAKTNQHLVMCSMGQVAYFKETYHKNAVCIPCAVNLPDLKLADKSNILDTYNLQKGKYFFFMGRLVQDKNPDYLIKAFKKIKNKGYKLVISGSNDVMPTYVDSLKQLAGDCKDIVFTGAVYGKDKARLLRDAYCFCLPSTIEGLSIVMIEAASYRLPIIASDIEANREFLKDDAVYVRPENVDDLINALEFVQNNSEQLRYFKEENFKKVINSFTWDKVALKYVEYLKSIGVK